MAVIAQLEALQWLLTRWSDIEEQTFGEITEACKSHRDSYNSVFNYLGVGWRRNSEGDGCSRELFDNVFLAQRRGKRCWI